MQTDTELRARIAKVLAQIADEAEYDSGDRKTGAPACVTLPAWAEDKLFDVCVDVAGAIAKEDQR
jgi:hypothetical protein